MYDKAVARYLDRVPAFVYLAVGRRAAEDRAGQRPRHPRARSSLLAGPDTFVNGLTQETCRDFTHTGYGISAISHVAETSRIQGSDLYPEIGERLRHALGFQSR